MTLSDKERKDERDSNQSLCLLHCAGKVNFSLQALLIFNFKSFRYKTWNQNYLQKNRVSCGVFLKFIQVCYSCCLLIVLHNHFMKFGFRSSHLKNVPAVQTWLRGLVQWFYLAAVSSFSPWVDARSAVPPHFYQHYYSRCSCRCINKLCLLLWSVCTFYGLIDKVLRLGVMVPGIVVVFVFTVVLFPAFYHLPHLLLVSPVCFHLCLTCMCSLLFLFPPVPFY